MFVPRLISAFSGIHIVRVTAGDTHSLALTAEGQLYTFGRNTNGQLGIGSNTDCASPVLVTAFEVSRVVKPRALSPATWVYIPPATSGASCGSASVNILILVGWGMILMGHILDPIAVTAYCTPVSAFQQISCTKSN